MSDDSWDGGWSDSDESCEPKKDGLFQKVGNWLTGRSDEQENAGDESSEADIQSARQLRRLTASLHATGAGLRPLVALDHEGGAAAIDDTVLLLALGVPSALLWGLVSFLFSFVPNIGFVIALIPPTMTWPKPLRTCPPARPCATAVTRPWPMARVLIATS